MAQSTWPCPASGLGLLIGDLACHRGPAMYAMVAAQPNDADLLSKAPTTSVLLPPSAMNTFSKIVSSYYATACGVGKPTSALE